MLKYLVILGLLLTSIQNPVLRNGGNQQKETHNQIADGQTSNQRCICVVKVNGDSSQQKTISEDDPHNWHNWIKAFGPASWSNWALFIAAIWAGCLALKTLHGIRTQADVMKSQTAILEKSVAAAESAALAAQQNIDITIMKERARVRVEIGDLEIRLIDGGWIGSVELKVFNIGATKAFISDTSAGFVLTSSREANSRESNSSKYLGSILSESVIHPTENPIEKKLYILSGIGPDTIRAINWEEQFAHLWGTIRYTDVFEQEHGTNFRYIWVPNQWALAADPASGGGTNTTLYGEWGKSGGEEDNSEH